VKRTILLIAGIAALAVAYFGAQLLAQGPGTAPAPQVPGTRVAVVNIATVFTGYKKAQFYKQEMEATYQPYKVKIESLQKEIYNAQVDLSKPGANKEQLEQKVLAFKRQLEDVQRQGRGEIGKKSEAQLIQLWNEINEVIDRTAKANAFNIVLAFGEPSDVEMKGLGAFANINRKMSALEGGSTYPLYFDRSVDITPVVVDTLNRSVAAQGAAAAPTAVQRQNP
jgi:Skp family chaperone for outer membrane proteins